MKVSTALALCAFFTALPASAQISPELVQSLQAAKINFQTLTEQLAKSREQVASERLPLSNELGQIEASLAALRKENDDVARVLDTRNLDINNLNTEMKLRQDESQYLSTLMDEFIRGLESKVHVSEMSVLQAPITAAKDAPQNPGLSVSEKFARQMAVLQMGLDRTQRIIGGARYEGTATDEQGTVKQGKFALIGPFALFASQDGSSTGIAITKTGATQSIIKPLEPIMNEGIAKVIATGEGFFPFDASNGNALKELLHKTSLIDTFIHGGPIMYPLLVVSLMATIVVIERLIFLSAQRARRKPEKVVDMLDRIEKGEMEQAVHVGRSTKDFVAKALTYALEHREKSVSNALMLSCAAELKKFNRGLPILDTCITLSPLLGLLGTVTGMMASFASLGSDVGSPGAITGGIAEALIATAFGIGIAIVAVIPFNMLNARIDDARHDLDAAATRMELLMNIGGGHSARQPMEAASSGGGGAGH